MDFTSDLIQSTIGSLFIAVMAQFSVDLPEKISAVPVTMQTFAVSVLPLLLGWKLAVMSCFIYWLEIAVGLPFAAGGEGGYQRLYHTTGGYLLGFIFSAIPFALLIGDTTTEAHAAQLQHRPGTDTFVMKLVALVLGNMIIFLGGLLWMPFGLGFKNGKSFKAYLNVRNILMWGLIPFIPGDILKIALALVVESVIASFVPLPLGSHSYSYSIATKSIQ